ncbi:hypothetical protein KAR91_16020 [Candidatus Pacearchaeota archaeon]|nr:hypothetical protein [Candidatus Pacearchaeota archaeon]
MISERYCGMRSIYEITREIKKDVRADPAAFQTCSACQGKGKRDYQGVRGGLLKDFICMACCGVGKVDWLTGVTGR